MRAKKNPAARRALAVLAVLALLSTLVVPNSVGDDRDLLRTNTADPYLFILLDTSLSMTLGIDETWVEGGADDPRSRLYQAREALYNVLRGVTGVNFGFATFNQDHVKALSKHYLYTVTDDTDKISGVKGPNGTAADSITTALNLASASAFPSLQDGASIKEVQIKDAATGATKYTEHEVNITGDLITFGRGYGETSSSTELVAGSCESPFSLVDATERTVINRFPKMGLGGNLPTKIWVTNGTVTNLPGGTKVKDPYLLTFKTLSGTLGDATINVVVVAEHAVDADGNGNPCVGAVADSRDTAVTETFKLKLHQEFFMADDGSGDGDADDAGILLDDGTGSASTVFEAAKGYWDLRDVQGGYLCGDDKPFSGGGWEGNYDTGTPFNNLSDWGNNSSEETGVTSSNYKLFDTYCDTASGGGRIESNCNLLENATTLGTDRALDYGDVIPFSLSSNNKEALLKRLNPNYKAGGVQSAEDLMSAPYFEDLPSSSPDVGLRVQSAYEHAPPVLAAGVSPVSDAILDFRCWYSNRLHDNGGKCGRSNLGSVYSTGFMEILQTQGGDFFRCRKPYFIIISDFDDNCPGNSPVANVASMRTDTYIKENGEEVNQQGVVTWALKMGGRNVQGLVKAGHGEQIDISTKDQLRDELEKILGLIRQEARSFASAAVPSVQADVDDKIYITEFNPRPSQSVWEGHIYAYVKPLQLVEVEENGVKRLAPDKTTKEWDAAEEILAQAPDTGTITVTAPMTNMTLSDFQIGTTGTDRRVYYPMLPIYTDNRAGLNTDKQGNADDDKDSLQVPRRQNYFGPVETAPTGLTIRQIWDDEKEALGLITEAEIGDISVPVDAFDQEALDTFKYHYEEKEVIDTSTGVPLTVHYVLGDIFHATPQLIGGPNNGRYLSRKDDFPGYQDFFERQERRRKILVTATNDGQLHAFDAGQFGLQLEDRCSATTTLSCRGDADCPSGETCSAQEEVWKFSNGSGRELFSIIPRALMPTMRGLTTSTDFQWSVDGTPAASDVLIDPVHDGLFSPNPPDPDEREWRTVMVAGLRRGGNSYVALDLTRPDPVIKYEPDGLFQGYRPDVTGTTSAGAADDQVVPECLTASGTGGPGNLESCDAASLPYPAILWEFTDEDLGDTWSTPDIGAIRVATSFDSNGDPLTLETRYVAIFGGGLDNLGFASNASTGDYLYMVDIETGKMIYKRKLDDSSAPAPPAAVDTDQDGFIDRIYIGTTGGNTPSTATTIAESKSGKLYRIDLDEPVGFVDGASCDPSLIPPRSTDDCCATQDHCIVDAKWEPYPIFDTISVNGTGTPIVPGTDKRIFFPPAVIFSTQLGRYAVAFGTGNREDLWSFAPTGPNKTPGDKEDGNRVYLFVDDSDLIDDPSTVSKAEVLRTEADFIDVTNPDAPETLSGTAVTSTDILDQTNGHRGWYFRLGVVDLTINGQIVSSAHEKIIGAITAISGINVVSSFIPAAGIDQPTKLCKTSCRKDSDCLSGETCDNKYCVGARVAICSDDSNCLPGETCVEIQGPQCARTGRSRSYAQFTSDSTPIRKPLGLTTDTWDPATDTCTGVDCRTSAPSPTLLSEAFIEQGGPCTGSDTMRQILIDEIFPPNCSFASYHWNLSAMRADTGVECLAQIPVCITERNWKDH